MKKLNIGCGKDWNQFEDFDGQDIVDLGQKYVFDLEKTPWPMQDESYDEIRAWNVLEHISPQNVIAVMNECWRILKLGGKFHIKVPRAPHENAFSDPTHKSFWTTKTFTEYLAGGSPRNADYGIKKWAIANDGKDKYLMEVDDRSIDIWLMK